MRNDVIKTLKIYPWGVGFLLIHYKVYTPSNPPIDPDTFL